MGDLRRDANRSLASWNSGALTVSPDVEEEIAAQIDRAFTLAARGAEAAAALSFSLVREMCVSLCDGAALTRRIENNTAGFVRERELYRELIAQLRSGSRELLVLGDSLGLPRPDDKSGPTMGADGTYSTLILDRLPDHGVQSYCQRFFTTRHVLELLQERADLGGSSDVVVHVGLNDCANRIFLEHERISLDLLPPETKEKVVNFGQQHRRLILRNLPSSHYVTPEEFRSNLETVLALLRGRGARRVVLATIVLPPARFWPATPGINRNFGQYNLIMMEVAARHGGLLLDIDRHVWARSQQDVLLPDGMHLSRSGHELFADELAALLT